MKPELKVNVPIAVAMRDADANPRAAGPLQQRTRLQVPLAAELTEPSSGYLQDALGRKLAG
jgi:hypothetical protein